MLIRYFSWCWINNIFRLFEKHFYSCDRERKAYFNRSLSHQWQTWQLLVLLWYQLMRKNSCSTFQFSFRLMKKLIRLKHFFGQCMIKPQIFSIVRGAQMFVKPCNLMPLGDKHYSCVCSHFVIAWHSLQGKLLSSKQMMLKSFYSLQL